MPTDLELHIAAIHVSDTHEHMHKEAAWQAFPNDILQVLFHHYIQHDFHVAGLRGADFQRLFPSPAATPTGSLAERWNILQPFWERCRHTGYGEASRLAAAAVFQLTEFTLPGLEQAQAQLAGWQTPGGRLKLLRETAGLDHIQTDDFLIAHRADEGGADFFLYDLNCAALVSGQIEPDSLHTASGVTVRDLPSLRTAMETMFERHAPMAVAIKSQHAYNRTLAWTERSDADAARALATALGDPQAADPAVRNCLGDWCWDQAARLAAQYRRPFKIHTGYYAGNDRMPLAFVAPGQMSRLLAKHLNTRFVLMHTAWPFGGEMVALAKHFQNVYADLCWAWSVDPHRTGDFVRNMLHAVPANKLFAFGGDTFLPVLAVGFARQMRRGLTQALQAEIAAGNLSETEAMQFADRVLGRNQAEVFDLAGTRAAVARTL